MTCKPPLGCGYEFCWVCMESWSTHSKDTGGYYKCNKYSEEVAEQKGKLGSDSKH
jgi:ariadne-1